MSQDVQRDAKLADGSTPDLRQRVADALDVYVRPREWALEAADAMLAVVQPELDRRARERDSLRQRFDDVREVHEQQRQSWERLLERVRAENKRLTQERDATNESHERMYEELEAANSRIQSLMQVRVRLQSEVDELTEEIASKNKGLREQGAHIQRQDKLIESLRAENKQLNAEIDDWHQRVEGLLIRKQRVGDERDRLRSEVDRLTRELSRTQSRLDLACERFAQATGYEVTDELDEMYPAPTPEGGQDA